MRGLGLVSVVAILSLGSAVEASIIPVTINRASLLRSNGSVMRDEGSPAVGWFAADVNFPSGFNGNGGYIFLLPAIPEGEQIDSIVFHAGNSNSWWAASTLQNLPSELYGFDVSTSRIFPDNTSYGSGTSQPGTKLTDGWFTGTVGALPDVDITDWVMDTGYVAGQYLRLRTATTADEATISSTQARWWTDRNNALVTITTSPVPEPAVAGIAGLSSLYLLRRRRA